MFLFESKSPWTGDDSLIEFVNFFIFSGMNVILSYREMSMECPSPLLRALFYSMSQALGTHDCLERVLFFPRCQAPQQTELKSLLSA